MRLPQGYGLLPVKGGDTLNLVNSLRRFKAPNNATARPGKLKLERYDTYPYRHIIRLGRVIWLFYVIGKRFP